MTGCCPYKDRCQFLHDLRVRARDAKARIRAKNQEEIIPDAHFWPVMDFHLVNRKLDMKNQPTVSQNYEVPIPQNDEYRRHDEAVFSMWNHFVEYCTLLLSIEPSGCYCLTMDQMAFLDEYNSTNFFTGNGRLSVLLKLSQGSNVENTSKQVASNVTDYQATSNHESKYNGGLNSYVDSMNAAPKIFKLRATAPEFKISPSNTPNRHSPATVPSGASTSTTATTVTTATIDKIDSDDEYDIIDIVNGLMKSQFSAISDDGIKSLDGMKSSDNRDESPFGVADILSYSPTASPLTLVDPLEAQKEFERLKILKKINDLNQQLFVLDNTKSFSPTTKDDSDGANQDRVSIDFSGNNGSVY